MYSVSIHRMRSWTTPRPGWCPTVPLMRTCIPSTMRPADTRIRARFTASLSPANSTTGSWGTGSPASASTSVK